MDRRGPRLTVGSFSYFLPRTPKARVAAVRGPCSVCGGAAPCLVLRLTATPAVEEAYALICADCLPEVEDDLPALCAPADPPTLPAPLPFTLTPSRKEE